MTGAYRLCFPRAYCKEKRALQSGPDLKLVLYDASSISKTQENLAGH